VEQNRVRDDGKTREFARIDLGKQFAIQKDSWREGAMRTKRSFAVSIDPFETDSKRAVSTPIFAVLAREPVFQQIAHDAHARFLIEGSTDNLDDGVSLPEWLARGGLVL
jgi:hypothetical protein